MKMEMNREGRANRRTSQRNRYGKEGREDSVYYTDRAPEYFQQRSRELTGRSFSDRQ